MVGFSVGGGGGVLAGRGEANAPAPRDAREASLSFAIEQMDPTLQRLYQQAMALEGILARLMGPHPQPAVDAKTEHEETSLIAKLNVRHRAFAELTSRIEELVRQFDQLL